MSELGEALLDAILGDKAFELKILSWRQDIHGARRSGSREHLDDHRIELKCRMQQSLLEGAITVVEDQAENLGDVNFSIELRGAQRIFSEFEAANPNSEVGKNAVGMLMYNHPIAEEGLAGLPSRIAERSKMGSVNGWIFYGIESIREISRLLTHQPGLDVCLIITVGAAASPKPLSLVYETKMYHPTTYRWLAKNNPLEIKDARFVATRPLGTGEDAHANSHAGSEEKGVAQARPSNSESDWRAKIRSALLR